MQRIVGTVGTVGTHVAVSSWRRASHQQSWPLRRRPPSPTSPSTQAMIFERIVGAVGDKGTDPFSPEEVDKLAAMLGCSTGGIKTLCEGGSYVSARAACSRVNGGTGRRGDPTPLPSLWRSHTRGTVLAAWLVRCVGRGSFSWR